MKTDRKYKNVFQSFIGYECFVDNRNQANFPEEKICITYISDLKILPSRNYVFQSKNIPESQLTQPS